MGIEALLSTQIIDTTTVGRSVMTAVDAAAARTALGLGTLATQNGTITDYLTTAAAATTYQPLDADLTALAALTGTDNLYYRSGASTWSSVTIGTGLTFSGGTLAASGGSGIGGSTGATDNLVLRADGTGGATLQNSNWAIPDVFTASPNATVNHLSLQATGSTTNVSVSIVPKGTGSFSLQVPDGTTAGGNARGAYSVDLQTQRANAADVASGNNCFVAGQNSRATGDTCIAIGWQARSTGTRSICIGDQGNAGGIQSIMLGHANGNSTGIASVAIGYNPQALAQGAYAIGYVVDATASFSYAGGTQSLADRYGMTAHAAGFFASKGDCQRVAFQLRNKTTDGTTAVTLFLDGSSARLTVPSGKILSGMVEILGSRSTGADVAVYTRHVAIKNVGGTTSLVGTVDTIGVDTAAGTTIAITADDTNDALQIAVTGVASQTWRWTAEFRGLELAYGT